MGVTQPRTKSGALGAIVHPGGYESLAIGIGKTPPFSLVIARVPVRVSANAFAGGPDLIPGAHLEHDLIKRPPRWTIDYVAYPDVIGSLMTGTFETATRGIKLHRTARVRALPAVCREFPFT